VNALPEQTLTATPPAQFLGGLSDLLSSATSVQRQRKSHLRWPLIWSLVVALLLLWGFNAHLERYITPDRGLGYALGITGASMMLLLLLYSARKRWSWLRWLGSMPTVFRSHMVLGVVGPLLVLFHTNFHLGSTNSNVALFSMLLVAASGVVGRYIYTRINSQLDGRQVSLEQLQTMAQRLRSEATELACIPGILDAIDSAERQLIDRPGSRAARALSAFTAGFRVSVARGRLNRLITQSVPQLSHDPQLIEMLRSYAEERLEMARRVAEYSTYARLFSYWHVLHIPLFFTLLFAAVVHVVAVNLY
jgi:hypothetical protein